VFLQISIFLPENQNWCYGVFMPFHRTGLAISERGLLEPALRS
jgi:hypothetical protein